MKIKTTRSSSGKKNCPKETHKIQEEKTSPVQVSQTSDVQPGDQESSTLIPQETRSRSESPSSEESTYNSCEDDGDDFDKNQEESVSPVHNPHSDVQPGDQESSTLIPQETRSRSESPSSEGSTYYSCEDADDFDDDVSLTKEQKCRFFQILRGLLEEPGSLENGKERTDQHDGKILKLMYMTERCEIIVQDLHFQFKEIVSTQDIYLRWNQNAEPLSLENLQKVRNELKFLKILNEKADACFSKAINEFMEEFKCVQKNTTLKLICDDIILTFVSGKGMNVAAVTYDDCNKKPKYVMKVRWRLKCLRFLHSGYRKICGFIDSLYHKICGFIDSLTNVCNTFTSLGNCILDWFRSWGKP